MKAGWMMVLLMGTLAASANAAPGTAARKYAVMSLIGDSFTVVTNNRQIGSRIDANGHDTYDLPPAVIDQPALIDVDDALQKANVGNAAVLLGTSSPVLREQQSELVSNGQLVHSDEIEAALKSTGADRLILIAKRRDEAALQLRNSQIGQGSLYGLGFYLDRYRRIRDTKSGEVGTGYIAPYAYFNIYLIDVASSSVLATRSVTASRTISNAVNKDSPDPWDILSPEKKAKTLNDMVRRQILAAVPEMVR